MAVIFLFEFMLKKKKVRLEYYECGFFTYDGLERMLYVPVGAEPLVVCLVLSKIK
ncbi:MAG: hypothetical protein FWE91_10945 [Defluviitaleaceae bacterium]|nr:hypothetical protein [Defluviitaleaceae bacterium]MCL2835191.1 hypothetical protein [Defluviitaleaceae bacterium]